MTNIGIDPSLNSTGICINNNGKCDYFLIVSKMTKKMQLFDNQYVKFIKYEKNNTNKKENSYEIIEKNKSNNIYSICKSIEEIIKKYDNCHVYMEGVSYGSLGSSALVDLSGLNFAIRNVLIQNNIPFTIVSPSQNKKFATGNGAADKSLMIFSWLKIEKHLKNITEIKIDDLADAYFLSNYSSQLR